MENLTAEIKTNGAVKTKNDFCFVEFVIGSIKNRNKVININEIKKEDYEGLTDCYISQYLFSEDFLKFSKNNKSVSGYQGSIDFQYIYLDFDNKENPEIARTDLYYFINYGLSEYLNSDELNQLRIYFSGSKGFHLAIPKRFFTNIKPSKDLHLRARAFVKLLVSLANEGSNENITSIDYSIYKSSNRIFRLNNTINSKTGLYKIGITYDELCNSTIDGIKRFAENKRYIDYDNNIKPNESLTELFNSVKIETNNEGKKEKFCGDIFEQGITDFNRNDKAFQLAKHWQNKGLNNNDIENIVSYWNNNNSEPLPEDEIQTILKSALKNNNGLNNREIDRSDFMNFDDRKKNYSDYIKDIENKKIEIGFKLIDDKIRGIRPGNVLTLLAETGIGKSAIVQNILQNYTKKTDKHTLYISLEMDNYELHERETQIEFNISGYEVEETYLKDRANFDSIHLNKFITLTDSIDINKLFEVVEKCSEYFGEIGLIAIDHVGIMDNRIFNDNEYSRITDVMKKIKRFALISKYPVCVISQVNRMEALKKSDRLSLFSGKGSGEVENSSNVVLALEKITAENYQIFKYKEDVMNEDLINRYYENGKNLLCLTILKNRRGGYIQSILEYDRRNLRIIESNLN